MHPLKMIASCPRFFVLVVAIVLAGRASANEQIYQKILPSTAWIVAGAQAGSGALIDEKKKILVTNFHVVGARRDVKVFFPKFNGTEARAERDYYLKHRDELALKGRVIVRDPRRDLALIQVEKLPDSARAIPLAKGRAIPGQTLHTIGNPSASEALWAYSSGTLRQSYNRRFSLDGLLIIARVLETQNPVNPGDSGGPLVNDRGELAGIVCGLDRKARLVSLGIDASELRALLAGDVKSIDERVGKSLRALGHSTKVNIWGRFEIQYGLEKGRGHFVYIDSLTYPFGKKMIREIWATAYHTKVDLSPELANALLKSNSELTVGGWEIRKLGNANHVIFRARVDENCDQDELRRCLSVVAHQANRLYRILKRPEEKKRPIEPAVAKPRPPKIFGD